jgi:hypothetical protein
MAARREPPLQDSLRRHTIAQICASVEPDDPRLAGALHEGHRATSVDYEADALEARKLGMDRYAYAAWRAAQRRPLACMVSGEPLSSETVAPFMLDGIEYRSVWCFYQCLKLLESDPRRASMARGECRSRLRTGGRRTFRYMGEDVAVGSREHGTLIVRAVEAKVAAHEHVRRTLLATGTCLLYMGFGDGQALARYMPFALMLARLRLWPRPML